jgi:uncharacterized protein
MNHAINWFELPAKDFNRAVTFYDTIFGAPLRRGEFGGMPHGFFVKGEESIGAVVLNPNYTPGAQGTVLYLNAGDQLDTIISRVKSAGGKVVLPKTSIGEQGAIAIVLDTEGNQVGLHAA